MERSTSSHHESSTQRLPCLKRRRSCVYGNFPAYYPSRRAFLSAANVPPVLAESCPSGHGKCGGPVSAQVTPAGLLTESSFSRLSCQGAVSSSEDVADSGHRNWTRAIDERLYAIISTHGNVFEGKDVLDVGCNAGALCLTVGGLLHARQVIGVDIDGKLIERASAALAALKRTASNGTPTSFPPPRKTRPPGVSLNRRAGFSSDDWSNEAGCNSETGSPPGFRRVKGQKTCAEPPESRVGGAGEQLGFLGCAKGFTGHPCAEAGAARAFQLFGPLWKILSMQAGGAQGKQHVSAGFDSVNECLCPRMRSPKTLLENRAPRNKTGDVALGGSRALGSVPGGEFPFNILFRVANIVNGLEPCVASAARANGPPDKRPHCICSIMQKLEATNVFPALPFEPCSFDVVVCFSVTKWIHLHYGDCGILFLFSQLHALLKPRGFLLLEPQDWASYRRARRILPEFKQQLKQIRLPPKTFTALLTSPCRLPFPSGTRCCICRDKEENLVGHEASRKANVAVSTGVSKHTQSSLCLRGEARERPDAELVPAREPPFVLVGTLHPWRKARPGVASERVALCDMRDCVRELRAEIAEEGLFGAKDALSGKRKPFPSPDLSKSPQQDSPLSARRLSEKDDEQAHGGISGAEVQLAESSLNAGRKGTKGRMNDRTVFLLRKLASSFSPCCCALLAIPRSLDGCP